MNAIGSLSSSANDIRLDYMTLLVTQLRNQDPMEPMKNDEMVGQLTQLSALEQLESQSKQLSQMNETFQEALVSAQRSQAAALLGKEVSFAAEDQFGRLVLCRELVDRVDVSGPLARLSAGPYSVGLEDVVAIGK